MALLVLSTGAVFGARNDAVGRAFNLLRPDVKMQITGTVNRNDRSLPLDKVDMVNSGEMLDWRIASVNEGNASAQSYRVVGQIPKGTEFVTGSASGEGSPLLEYSIDGGGTFASQPTVPETQADGSVKQVPAPVSMYTQVRFHWAAELAVNATVGANYRVRVK